VVDNRDVIASLVFWVALFLALAGVAMLVRRSTRRFGRALFIYAITAIVIALAWPALIESRDPTASHLDRLMPQFQFSERHAIHVGAPPERVYRAIRAVTAGDIRFFRTLTAIRRLGRPLPPGILNASPNEPILDLATRTSFRWLADDPLHELVVGTRVGRDTDATMNFLITPDGRGGSNLSTETRVHAATDSAARRFAVYWRIIRPGSDIIRRSWLRAVKRRAEGTG
jgi:hypothetical protein